MPAKSIKQQRFMGMVHAAQKKGGKAASPEIAKVAKSIKKKDAKEFASTKHKGLPKKVKSEGLREAKDETMRHGDKGRPPSGYNKSSWDWKIHSKGSYWQSREQEWGARAKSGQVDYFVSKITAIRFAEYTHKGGPASYVQGNFLKGKTEGRNEGIQKIREAKDSSYKTASEMIAGKGKWQNKKHTAEFDKEVDALVDRMKMDKQLKRKSKNEGLQKIREYVRSMVQEILVERRKVRKEAYDPGAEGERAGKLDNLATKHGITMRKGESRDDFEDRVSVANEGVAEGGPGSGRRKYSKADWDYAPKGMEPKPGEKARKFRERERARGVPRPPQTPFTHGMGTSGTEQPKRRTKKNSNEGVIEGGPGSGPHRTGSLARGSRHKGGDAARMTGDIWVDSKWGDRKYAAKNSQGKVLHFGSKRSAAKWASKITPKWATK